MRRSKSGRIVNISSMAVSLEPEGDSVYAACKAGLTTLSNVLAKEFAASGGSVAMLARKADVLATAKAEVVTLSVTGREPTMTVVVSGWLSPFASLAVAVAVKLPLDL